MKEEGETDEDYQWTFILTFTRESYKREKIDSWVIPVSNLIEIYLMDTGKVRT